MNTPLSLLSKVTPQTLQRYFTVFVFSESLLYLGVSSLNSLLLVDNIFSIKHKKTIY